MMRTLINTATLLIFISLLSPATTFAADIAFLVLDANSYLANRSVNSLKPEIQKSIQVGSAAELTEHPEMWQQKLDDAEIIIVDVMGKELEEFVSSSVDISKKTVYALRGSSDDEQLKKEGFIFDETVASYYAHISELNIKNMLRLVMGRHIDPEISYESVVPVPQIGIYHPEADTIFSNPEQYFDWLQTRKTNVTGKPRIGLLFFSSFLTPGQKEPIDRLIHRLEQDGFTVLPCFGKDQDVIDNFLLDNNDDSRVDLVLAYSLKFYSALTPALAKSLTQLDVPVFSAISLYKDTVEEWRKSKVGVGRHEIAWAMATPEISGLIEPTVLTAKERIVDPDSGKTYSLSKTIDENIERLLPRLHSWINLQQKDNSEKKVAILFYNHHQGKQNIGASYLNVFRSLESILSSLAQKGYSTGSTPDEKEIKKLILSGARNVGSWAHGELDKMVKEGELILLDPATYKSWFQALPSSFQDKVIAQWGQPQDAKVMMYEGKIVIPAVQRGNIVMMPEPAKGWSDDPLKLYHDTKLYPHHQYLAAYLWLEKQFGADAMIHLGTHATYEWTPGKQAGLSPACTPEVLITNIPNLYPYIVDNIGEALQAKRRGRGVMISHLTPLVKRSGLYEEYARLSELVDEYERAILRGSKTAEEKLKEILLISRDTGVLTELANYDHDEGSHQHEHSHLHDNANASKAALVHDIGHYLDEIKEQSIPYGVHTFGGAKDAAELQELSAEILLQNPEEESKDIIEKLHNSPQNELDSLLRGLEGKYVSPGEGNDPMRNPSALPTGRNLYGFNPNRLPSAAAWQLGKKAADEIIKNHLHEHGDYPQKVAVIVWAVELLRNEGVSESTILWLMGIRPTWQKNGRVSGLEVVTRKELGRPRIDVLINPSGLYRDLFPEKIVMLDDAVQLAIRQTDIDNLLMKNSVRMKAELIQKGMSKEDAEEMSRLRIFTEEPGAYGNGVGDMASALGLWNDETKIVDVMENRVGFAFSGKRWGMPAKKLLARQLADVEAVVHSSSSNIYGLLDNDDMFQYLGGLSMAVRKESGKTPQTYITTQKIKGKVKVEDLSYVLAREIRARYLNPKWIKGMQREDYAGATAMSQYMEYLWGWQVTTPDKVTAQQWQQTFEVYVEDKYNLNMKQFFDKASPWAYQSMSARMLETVRKGYWQPADEVRQKLAKEYALSVINKGVACCDHTCNNPMLNQMVVSILSLPGIMSPELVEQFKIAVEQAVQLDLNSQVENREKLVDQLEGIDTSENKSEPQPQEENSGKQKGTTDVKGYKMEKMKQNDDTTQVTSSGVEWFAGLLVMAILGLALLGTRKSL